MVDEQHLHSVKLRQTPRGQLLWEKFLRFNYFWTGTTVKILGIENIPKNQSVLIAMNHTDRYTCWPFQQQLYRIGGHRFTAAWVKAKYFQNRLMRGLLGHCNVIPLPSRGYLILRDGEEVLGRKLTSDEYRWLRDASDGIVDQNEIPSSDNADLQRVIQTKRNDYQPANESYHDYIERANIRVMTQVEAKTLEALHQRHCHVVVFPQGTRSIRLLPSRTGLVQLALRHRIPIVPVGAMGVDVLYPGGSPWGKKSNIVYRVGKALTIDNAFADLKIDVAFSPFTREAKRFDAQFKKGAEILTNAINNLLDEKYQMSSDVGVKASRTNSLI